MVDDLSEKRRRWRECHTDDRIGVISILRRDSGPIAGNAAAALLAAEAEAPAVCHCEGESDDPGPHIEGCAFISTVTKDPSEENPFRDDDGEYCEHAKLLGDCSSCSLYNAAVHAQQAAAKYLAETRRGAVAHPWVNEFGFFAHIDGIATQIGSAVEAAPFATLTTAALKAAATPATPPVDASERPFAEDAALLKRVTGAIASEKALYPDKDWCDEDLARAAIKAFRVKTTEASNSQGSTSRPDETASGGSEGVAKRVAPSAGDSGRFPLPWRIDTDYDSETILNADGKIILHCDDAELAQLVCAAVNAASPHAPDAPKRTERLLDMNNLDEVADALLNGTPCGPAIDLADRLARDRRDLKQQLADARAEVVDVRGLAEAYKGLIEANHRQFCLLLEKLNAAESSLAAAIRDRDRALAFEVTEVQREAAIAAVRLNLRRSPSSHSASDIITDVLIALRGKGGAG